MNHNHFKRILPIAIVALFLACEGNFKEITDEERQAMLSQSSSSVKQSSSSGEALSSSSSETSSSSISSSSEASSSSTLGDGSSSSESLCADFDEPDKFCDERDGKEYRYVEIGDQTWMAQNLNYAGTGNLGNYYYDEIFNPYPELNYNNFGRLYDWETAKKACPDGWHLPSEDELKTLIFYVESLLPCDNSFYCAGKLLKATNQCSDNNCEDAYGFSALMGGYYDNIFNSIGASGYWWSATAKNDEDAVYLNMNLSGDNAVINYDYKTLLLSVRCVKDN